MIALVYGVRSNDKSPTLFGMKGCTYECSGEDGTVRMEFKVFDVKGEKDWE